MARTTEQLDQFKERLRSLRRGIQLWYVDGERIVVPAGFESFVEGAEHGVNGTLCVNMRASIGPVPVMVTSARELDEVKSSRPAEEPREVRVWLERGE